MGYRDISSHMEEIYGIEISKSSITAITDKVLPKIKEQQNRPLDEVYPIIWDCCKSNFGKNQVDIAGSIKGVDNFREEYLLNTKIPFPTTSNHQEPEKIEKLVSIITQNIIDKEEKNKKIDELIEKELRKNQKSENNFKYSYPKISEIKKESRLNTGIYEREFKEIDFLIRNYEGGFFKLCNKGYIIKRGQNL